MPPSAPNVYVKSVSNGEITIEWSKPEKAAISITNYTIEIMEITAKFDVFDTISTHYEWVYYDTVNPWTLEYTLKNLKIGGMYSIRVAAQNSAGCGVYGEIKEPVIAKDMAGKIEFEAT